MKRILVTLVLLLAVTSAHAVTVSSTTASLNGTPALLLQPNESLTYKITGTFTGRIVLQKSRNQQAWTPLDISTTNNAGGIYTGVVSNDDHPYYFRWQASTITAGSFVTELTDNDDFVKQEVGLKKAPVLKIHDESVRFPQRVVYDVGSTVALSSNTPLNQDNLPRYFNVITSSGGAITMNTTPAISTTPYADGTMYMIQSATATVTFQDDGTLSGSLLELGSTTRALGVGDILILVYRSGKWWEAGFFNN